MKLITKLTEEDRANLAGRIAEMDAISARQRKLTNDLIFLGEQLHETLKTIIVTERKADALDEEASVKLPGLREHRERMEKAIENIKARLDGEFCHAMNEASAAALADIKALCAPLEKPHRAMIENLIAPYFTTRPRTEGIAGEFDSVNDLFVFIRLAETTPFADRDNARAQFDSYRQRIAGVLADGVVWKMDGSEAA
jgi:hypothetical protein